MAWLNDFIFTLNKYKLAIANVKSTHQINYHYVIIRTYQGLVLALGGSKGGL